MREQETRIIAVREGRVQPSGSWGLNDDVMSAVDEIESAVEEMPSALQRRGGA